MDTVVMLALSDKAGETLAEGASYMMILLGVAAVMWAFGRLFR